MNYGIELYRQAHGQWINVDFPKELLPIAGGGGCPYGMRVKNENDIIIKMSGCCMGDPYGFHFDGKTWNRTKDYTTVDELLSSRYPENTTTPNTGKIQQSKISNWPFEMNSLIPNHYTHFGYRERTKITVDKDSILWLAAGMEISNNSTGTFSSLRHASGGWGDDPNLAESTPLEFGPDVFYYQTGKRPYSIAWIDPAGYVSGRYFYIDTQEQVWFYYIGEGLSSVKQGRIKVLGQIPEYVSWKSIGGVFPLRNGEIWVGSQNVIWKFKQGIWQKFIIPGNEQLFTHFVEDKQGIVYAATNEGVYKIDNETYEEKIFVRQWHKPYIMLEGNENLRSFHKRYELAIQCDLSWPHTKNTNPEYNYESKYLGLQEDETLIYINTHIIAKLENGIWKSFAFDAATIDSATVAPDGSIWIFSEANGLFQLAPDIFEEYSTYESKEN